jgi:hypothetical protein
MPVKEVGLGAGQRRVANNMEVRRRLRKLMIDPRGTSIPYQYPPHRILTSDFRTVESVDSKEGVSREPGKSWKFLIR